ncbi:uncharacterized protein LOC131674731 [Phymastichus coffea]|uniref:uncharacterized protein LOC131671847 n=1 Tax=Phymastichus coffea TaxID=108790 RepID=UPI00273CA2F0|nr:uncharacterized protein LOC131671847 [Phymastichus coffea]XP_058808049.1 uncharacterized protein LOC131673789 [Phymastichus coffea]XP_058808523.1 uncharacterized protein LOC131674056 [Phymastichus coffea]XP_058809558.1 uncharacterized protein LOC131674731 [Phymastichus coffea]
MADTTVGDSCAGCGLAKKKMSGYKQTVSNEEEATTLSDVFARTVVVNDILCIKCAGAARFARSKQRKLEHVPQTESQESSSSSEVASQPSHSDPPFQLSKKLLVDNKKEEETIELPYRRITSTHNSCCLCGKKSGFISVPFEARHQVFVEKQIFIPKGNRCCTIHLINKKFYADEINNLTVVSHSSLVTVDDITKLFQAFTVTSDRELHHRVGDFAISEKRIQTFTGLNWEQLIRLREMMTSLRNTDNRTVNQALVIFLFRLRTGNSNEMISSVFGLDRPQQVSEFSKSILKSFEKDVLPSRFGLKAVNRNDLIENHSTILLQKLHNIKDSNLTLVGDGTYLKHQKSANNEYQRRSYSGHKKLPLCKPFTICTTDGYIVDVLGPFSAKDNDAKILEQLLTENDDLKNLMCKAGDVFVLDRGFRDVLQLLENMKYRVLMPSLKKQGEKQLTAEAANNSRRVTMIRWVVEAVHGAVAQKYKIFHQQLDNRFLVEASLYCKVVCFLINEFGKRLVSRASTNEDILNQVISKHGTENTLAEDVATGRWSRRTSEFTKLSSSDVDDFPEMTENDLITLFTGTYQLQQSISYLAEMIDDNNEMTVQFHKDVENILKLRVRSRHIEKKTYNCYIDYKPNSIGCGGIQRYYCECANGMRTIGCCSHVAAVVYYLSHARYLSRILRPAEHLTKIFERNEVVPVIEEDSDEDS